MEYSQVGHVASQTGGLPSAHSSSHPRAAPSSSPVGSAVRQVCVILNGTAHPHEHVTYVYT